MKKIPRLLVPVIVIMLAILACNLPGGDGATQEFPPTPNATMTELYALATILTPAATEAGAQTPTPAIITQNTATFTPQIEEETEETEPNTPSRTFTAIPPTRNATQRGGTLIKAVYLSDPPDIDGDWGEWNTTQYGANNVVFGANHWENGDDLEAAYRVGWDEDYLYWAVKVRDDRYVQRETEENLYKGDSIEMLLDVNLYGDFNQTVLSPDDYQLGISPGYERIGSEPEAYLWFPTEKTGSKGRVLIAAIKEDDVYRVEFAVPWTLFNIEAEEGMHFGFALSVNDNDNTSENVQQSMVSSAARRTLINPTTWGELFLSD